MRINPSRVPTATVNSGVGSFSSVEPSDAPFGVVFWDGKHSDTITIEVMLARWGSDKVSFGS